MVLYKPGCDSNDCELLSGQATLARRVACGEAACGVGSSLTSRRGVVIHVIAYSFDCDQLMEKLTNCNQRNLTIKTRPMLYIQCRYKIKGL